MKVNTDVVLNNKDNKELILANLITSFYKDEDFILALDDDCNELEVKITVKGKQELDVNVESFVTWLADEFDILDEKLDKLQKVFVDVFDY